MKRLIIPSIVLLLGLTIGAYAQFVGGLGSALVSAALQQPAAALPSDLIVTYRGATGASVISPVSTLAAGPGVPPALTGTCASLGTQVGGNLAGSFVATCTAQTAVLTFLTPAPHGWVCDAQDQTTPADTMKQTANTAAGCTLTGTTVAGDVIVFNATAF